MEKLLAFFMTVLICSCGPLPETQFITYQIFLSSDETTLANPSITFNLSCTQVFGGSGTFTQNGIVVTGPTGSIQVLSNTACTLTAQSFSDGTNTYTPNPTSLVISISAAGTVTSSGTLTNPPNYLNLSTKVYLYMTAGSISSITFKYIFDPVVQTVTYVPAL